MWRNLSYFGLDYGSYEEYRRQPIREIAADFEWLKKKKKAEARAAKGK